MTKNYEILGWELPICKEGAQRLLQVCAMLANSVDKFCLEAHVCNIAALEKLGASLRTERFAMYGWRTIKDGSVFGDEEFSSIQSARIVFGEQLITVSLHPQLPPYDWPCLPTGTLSVGFVQQHKTSISEPDPAIVEALRQFGAMTVGELLPVKTSTVMSGGCRSHHYTVFIPPLKAGAFIGQICGAFNLRDGTGTFEILGSTSMIANLARSGVYRLDGFPTGCWSFNDGYGRTPFAIERASFLYPVLNLAIVDLLTVADIIDGLGSEIGRCSVIRKYVSWNLPNGHSPRTQNNYILLSRKQKGNYALLVGFEQHADADPSAKNFTETVISSLGPVGLKLKSIPYIK